MIASVHGKVVIKESDALVVEVGGIGMRVYCVGNTLRNYEVGETAHLQTHLVVREDLLALYGFESQAELDLFSLLLGANGIGPRSALGILSTLSPEVIRRAVLAEQPDVFARVPGIGRKTAQKLILHLQGKVGTGDDLVGSEHLDVDSEVINALTALGYSVVEAQAAVQSIPRDGPQELEARLRIALQFFAA